MFGVSFTELLLIGAVVLMVVGPQRLPKMLGTLGRWSAKLRNITSEVRQQSGIDDLLRKEGITGGLSELRELKDIARGNWTGLAGSAMAAGKKRPAAAAATSGAQPAATSSLPAAAADPYADVPYDRSREYPSEGCDAYDALPDDLWFGDEEADPTSTELEAAVASSPSKPATDTSSTEADQTVSPPGAGAEASEASPLDSERRPTVREPSEDTAATPSHPVTPTESADSPKATTPAANEADGSAKQDATKPSESPLGG